MEKSLQIQQRIEETQALISAKEDIIAQTPTERRKILGGEEVDQTALQALDERWSALKKVVEDLTTRLGLLEKQREEAERQESAARLLEIAGEAARLAASLGKALAELTDAEGVLLAKARTVVEIHTRHFELLREKNDLTKHYSLSPVAIPPLAELDFFPKFTTALGEVFAPLNDARHSTSPWGKKAA
jgi:Rad3-related DNA helicase